MSTPDPTTPRRRAQLRLRRVQAVQRHRQGRRSPRGGRRGRHPVLISLGVLLSIVLVASYSGVQIAFAVLDGSLGQLPDPKPIGADTLVYDRAGTLIAVVHPPGESRMPVALAAIAPTLVQATVAIEDRGFWQEGAANPQRMVAAAWDNLQHGDARQGASTITQQLAKVRFLDDTKTIDRKLRELFIARRLDATLTKPQILQEYLNDIFYGHGASGIESAAHVYFGKNAAALTLPEASMLAGLPNHPTDLDPLLHLAAAKARQREVLAAMVANNNITKAQADAALAAPLTFRDGSVNTLDRYPAFTERVIENIQDTYHLDAHTAGLRVVSTLNSNLQDAAQVAVTQQVDSLNARYHMTDGAVVSADPQTGDILAYVGGAGPGHPGSLIDMASAPRQPGSTFKVFTYATAIAERRLTMTMPITDGPFALPTGGGPLGLSPYAINNYDHRYHGTVPAQVALGNSFNVTAVKTELLAGVPEIVQFARSLGVDAYKSPYETSYGASMTLGTYPIPLWQMAQAGSAFATGGVLHPSRVVLSVKDPANHELVTAPAGRQVMDPGVAFIMNRMLSDDSNRVLEFGPNSSLVVAGHQVAAKTGTTQDFKDNLTLGWTPHLVTATWVGNTDNSAMRGVIGITGAAPIFNTVMSTALKGVPDDWAAAPPSVKAVPAGSKTAWYLPTTSPTGVSEGACASTRVATPAGDAALGAWETGGTGEGIALVATRSPVRPAGASCPLGGSGASPPRNGRNPTG